MTSTQIDIDEISPNPPVSNEVFAKVFFILKFASNYCYRINFRSISSDDTWFYYSPDSASLSSCTEMSTYLKKLGMPISDVFIRRVSIDFVCAICFISIQEFIWLNAPTRFDVCAKDNLKASNSFNFVYLFVGWIGYSRKPTSTCQISKDGTRVPWSGWGNRKFLGRKEATVPQHHQKCARFRASRSQRRTAVPQEEGPEGIQWTVVSITKFVTNSLLEYTFYPHFE